MWREILQTGYFVSFEENKRYEIFITDYVSIWYTFLSEEQFYQILKDCNTTLEIEKGNLLKAASQMLLNPSMLKSFDISLENNKISILLKKSYVKLELNLDQGSKELFFTEVTKPLLESVNALRSSDNELQSLLKAKDTTLEFYKDKDKESGGKLPARFKTAKFNEETHRIKQSVYHSKFDSEFPDSVVYKDVEVPEKKIIKLEIEDSKLDIKTEPLNQPTDDVNVKDNSTKQENGLAATVKLEIPESEVLNRLVKQEQIELEQKNEVKMDSDDDICTPPDILELATKVTHNLMPEKSRKLYEKEYNNFLVWKSEKKTTSFSENVILAYLKDLSDKFKPSSMWAKYSMLKSTLSIYNNIDITKYSKVIAFLKHSSEGHKEKKSLTFTSGQIKMFLEDSPDILFLFEKVALIFGIMGACRRQELYNIQFDEVANIDDGTIMVKVSKTKTKIDRSFVVTGKCYAVCKKYMELRPTPCRDPAFFLSYRSGKCIDQRTGINKFGALGKIIASFLNLPNPALYTGHCFRRTSAALLIDSGGDLTALERHGGWKSSTVAESYIDESSNE